MRADLPERLETLARECSDALMFDGRKALTEAALALRALRDAPVVTCEADGPIELAGQRVRLVADGDTTTGGVMANDANVVFRENGRLQRCNCGCNVFHKIAEDRYGCNACPAQYVAERREPAADPAGGQCE